MNPWIMTGLRFLEPDPAEGDLVPNLATTGIRRVKIPTVSKWACRSIHERIGSEIPETSNINANLFRRGRSISMPRRLTSVDLLWLKAIYNLICRRIYGSAMNHQ